MMHQNLLTLSGKTDFTLLIFRKVIVNVGSNMMATIVDIWLLPHLKQLHQNGTVSIHIIPN